MPRTTWHECRFRLPALLFLASTACSGDDSPAGPDEEIALAVITGPSEVSLTCSMATTSEFDALASSGRFSRFSWEVDGTPTADGPIMEYTFTEGRSHVVKLSGYDTSGSVISTASQPVSVSLPADIPACLGQATVQGRQGVLLRTGATSVTESYTLSSGELGEGLVDTYRWTVTPEGGAVETVANGADAYSAQVTFAAGGSYEIGVEQVMGGTTLTLSLPVKVYTGEPVSEPGKIAFFNGPNRNNGVRRGPSTSLYFMDGETGHVTGPIVEGDDSADSSLYIGMDGACDSERVIFTATVPGESTKYDLWQVNHDGSDLKVLVDAVGIVQNPDINAYGDVAFVDDTRWDFARDELAVYRFSGGSYMYASGSAVDAQTVGFHPSWSPSGARIALGNTDVLVDGTVVPRVSIYNAVGNFRRLPDDPPEYTDLGPGEVVHHEGFGVAWDPKGEYLAYNLAITDKSSPDPFSWTTKQLIALWTIGSSEVRILTEGVSFGWSPNGEYLLFNPVDGEVFQPGIWQIPREGGEPVNLSAITMEGAHDVLAGFCR